MVETADFANLALFNPTKPTENDWSTLFSIENPFLGYPTCLVSALVFGGGRHRGRQGQLGEEDQGGRWH